MKCRKCGNPGHFTKDCTQGAASPAPAPVAEPPRAPEVKPEPEPKQEPTLKTEPKPAVPAAETSQPCYKCGELGHNPRECKGPTQRKCAKCGETGHAAKDCTGPKAAEPAKPKPEPVPTTAAEAKPAKFVPRHQQQALAEAAKPAAKPAPAIEKPVVKAEELVEKVAEKVLETVPEKPAVVVKQDPPQPFEPPVEKTEPTSPKEKAQTASVPEAVVEPAPVAPAPVVIEFDMDKIEEMRKISEQAARDAEEVRLQEQADMMAQLTPNERLAAYYAQLRPERRNLFAQMSAAKFFLVEGDALVLEVLANSTLDHRHGGQLLQIVYLVERYLAQFSIRGGLFNIVFFDCHAAIWGDSTLGLLVRQVIIQHFSHTPSVTLLRFPNYWCDEWVNFLDENKPAFILVGDGEQSEASIGGNLSEHAAFWFRSFLFHSIAQWRDSPPFCPLHCVFAARVIPQGTKASGFVVTTDSQRAAAIKELFWADMHEECKATLQPPPCGLSADQIGKLNANLPVGFRTAATACALSDVLATCDKRYQETFVGLAKCALLHAALLDVMPLNWRGFLVSDGDNLPEPYTHFVSQLQRALSNYVSASEAAHRRWVVDIFDGRVFLFATQFASENTKLVSWKLPSAATEVVKKSWPAVSKAALEPLLTKAIVPYVKPEPLEQPEDFLPPSNVLKEVMGTTFPVQTGGNYNRIMEDAQDLPSRVQPMHTEVDFLRLWEDFDRIKEEAEEAEGSLRKLPVAVQIKKALKNKQNLSRMLLAQATSLEGGSFIGQGEILVAQKETKKKQKKEKEKDAKGKTAGEDAESETSGSSDDEAEVTSVPVKTTEDKKDKEKKDKKEKDGKEKKEKKEKDGKEKKKDKDDDKKKGKKDKDEEKEEKKVAKGGKPKEESMKEKILRQNQEKIERERAEKERKKWDTFRAALDRDPFVAIGQLSKFIPGIDESRVAIDCWMHMLKLRFDVWNNAVASQPEPDLSIAGLVVLAIQEITEKFQAVKYANPLTKKDDDVLTGEHRRTLIDYYVRLGLTDAAEKLAKHFGLPVRTVTAMERLFVPRGTTVARLQLNHVGHLLKRPVSGIEDARVGFRPDLWQKYLLDVIDNDESALVCAPTSSGKTFISFYCMKRILRRSDEGLVIFVAPNKQLAHQVIADVFGQFKSKTYKNAGWVLYGEYTDSTWTDIMHCQVLVTTPECLDTLLLSPLHYKAIHKRLEYIIVDEVHCVDELVDGALWERMLVLARCPVLALSATVGNLDEFHAWMQRVQNTIRDQDVVDHKKHVRKSYKVHKVPDGKQVKEIKRYSDLQKYVFLPQRQEDRERWNSTRPKVNTYKGCFQPVNPCSQLTVHQLATKGFPGDLSLVPRESVELYDQLARAAAQQPEVLATIKHLEPEAYFAANLSITQTDARNYEAEVKNVLQEWSRAGGQLGQLAANVIHSLSDPLNEKIETSYGAAGGSAPDTVDFLAEQLVHLMNGLAAQDMLPALIFNLEQSSCELLAARVTEYLERKEADFKQTPQFKRMKADLDHRLKVAERRIAANEKMQKAELKKSEKGGKDEEDKGAKSGGKIEVERPEELDLGDLGSLAELDVLRDFTFVTSESAEARAALDSAERRLGSKDHILYRCLLRGIGVHHGGLSYKYRQAVEMLFRMKHIKFVISTETMALGIHMPCRTVVFAGDNVALNPLQYRQMSGRSGRRGFDMVGHVVFFGLPPTTICRLMTSDLPSLKGHWPLTPALAQRLVSLYRHPKFTDHEKLIVKARRQMESLWMAPLFKIGNLDVSLQARSYFNACIEFLTLEGMVDADGGQIGFAEMSTRAFYRYEPYAWSVLALLRQGALLDVCSRFDAKDTSVLEREERDMIRKTNDLSVDVLLLVLCHATVRREVHRCALRDKSLERQKVHQVVLPSLRSLPDLVDRSADGDRPSDAEQERVTTHRNELALLAEELESTLRSVHDNAVSAFTAHLRNVAALAPPPPAVELQTLPFSRLTVDEGTPEPTGTFFENLAAVRVHSETRSPFATLSGRGDTYTCPAEMEQAVRPDIYVDRELFPTTELFDTAIIDDGVIPLNAGVFDFQHSVSKEELWRLNGLLPKDAFQDLTVFFRVIKRLEFAFRAMGFLPSEPKKDAAPFANCFRTLCDMVDQNQSVINDKLTNTGKKKQLVQTAKKAKRPPLVVRRPGAPRRR